MITERDLQEAIAECEGVRNPKADTCIKLAAFYTIRRELFGADPAPTSTHAYSFAAPEDVKAHVVSYDGDGVFSDAINGMDEQTAWGVMDELMETLKAVNPRLYAGVMRELKEK